MITWPFNKPVQSEPTKELDKSKLLSDLESAYVESCPVRDGVKCMLSGKCRKGCTSAFRFVESATSILKDV